MAVGVTNDTFSESAYVTIEEYRNAPTALDTSNLVAGGNQAAQDAELFENIMRASSYMNEYLNQNLVASIYTETQRTRITPQGWISLHPFNSPVVSLSSFAYGVSPLSLIQLGDCSQTWFEGQQIIIPLTNATWSSQGPLGFGFPPSTRSQIFVKYTYTSGFVNTKASGTAAASSMTVADATGIIPGAELWLNDSSRTEHVYVADNYTLGSLTVPLVSPLVSTHTSVSCGNLPGAIKQACILITSAFISVRGDQALTMSPTTRPSGQAQGQNVFGTKVALALDMVDKYRRIR
jgi:hypothetical protein